MLILIILCGLFFAGCIIAIPLFIIGGILEIIEKNAERTKRKKEDEIRKKEEEFRENERKKEYEFWENERKKSMKFCKKLMPGIYCAEDIIAFSYDEELDEELINKARILELYLKNNNTCDILHNDYETYWKYPSVLNHEYINVNQDYINNYNIKYWRRNLDYEIIDNKVVIKFKDGGTREFTIKPKAYYGCDKNICYSYDLVDEEYEYIYVKAEYQDTVTSALIKKEKN